MFSRKVAYEAGADSGALDELSRKLSGDLRKHVRKLEHSAPLSREWLVMIDSFLHISNIALMEHRLPREDDTATLWEGEELTVRYLLEEGKLNLCLRLMHEYKRKKRELDADSAAAALAAQTVGLEPAALEARTLVFEQSLSVLLKVRTRSAARARQCPPRPHTVPPWPATRDAVADATAAAAVLTPAPAPALSARSSTWSRYKRSTCPNSWSTRQRCSSMQPRSRRNSCSSRARRRAPFRSTFHPSSSAWTPWTSSASPSF